MIVSAASSSAALDFFAHMARKSTGRGRLPTWVVRIRSVLRFIGAASRLFIGKLGERCRQKKRLCFRQSNPGAISNRFVKSTYPIDAKLVDGQSATASNDNEAQGRILEPNNEWRAETSGTLYGICAAPRNSIITAE